MFVLQVTSYESGESTQKYSYLWLGSRPKLSCILFLVFQLCILNEICQKGSYFVIYVRHRTFNIIEWKIEWSKRLKTVNIIFILSLTTYIFELFDTFFLPYYPIWNRHFPIDFSGCYLHFISYVKKYYFYLQD